MDIIKEIERNHNFIIFSQIHKTGEYLLYVEWHPYDTPVGTCLLEVFERNRGGFKYASYQGTDWRNWIRNNLKGEWLLKDEI